jgi:2,5-diketo-D-gluconate reductase A
MGVGTWTLRGETARQNVRLALNAGFRHIDTAQMYENEVEVGQGIADSNIPRNEVFLTTKIVPNTMRQGAEAVRRSIDESLARLQTDYLDLLLIHWPVKGCIKDTWQVMEDYVRQEKVRSIGVSNFNPHHLDDLLTCNMSHTEDGSYLHTLTNADGVVVCELMSRWQPQPHAADVSEVLDRNL